MVERPHSRTEEVIRALAAAAAAVRLYPPTSDIRTATMQRLVDVSAAVTAELGPVRVVVEPKQFRLGEDIIGAGQPQLSGLAETLYAHQVGQLIVAPGLTPQEAEVFLSCAASDPAAVREEGGLRHVTVTAGVAHIAVIELTLRASTEEGLLGLDLTSAPLETIGNEVVRAAADWAKSGAEGEGRDEMAEAIERLEPAARELAEQRVAEALLRLDETTRAAVMAAAMRRDAGGKTMEGMLEVVAHMSPAALARLLAMTAARSGADPGSMLAELELPPEAARALALMLRTSPRGEAESGVPGSVDAPGIAAEAMREDEDDEEHIRAAVSSAGSAAAAVRALNTTLAIAGPSPTAEAIEAIGEAIPPALAQGAFAAVHKAVEVFARADEDPALEVAVARARQWSGHEQELAQGLERLAEPGQAADAGAVLAGTGVAGAEALLEAWRKAQPQRRGVLEAVARAVPEQLLSVVGRRVRTSDAEAARELVGLLARLGDRRAVPALAQALEHPSREVRLAAVAALAAQGSPDAWKTVASALRHADDATASRALAEIRAAKPAAAGPELVSMLDLRRPLERTWEFRREVIECVGEMRVYEAVPALQKEAGRVFAIGHSRRALRQAARDALAKIVAAAQS